MAASRVKEDERNERIIRGLLKLPANKRCINCNNLGPQYVCTNFSTFVCTNCSGAHREFTHRVKSVSMAKFTAQEVSALQSGGNERAREVFFKEWDSDRNSYPDSSNADKLRNFIKHVYVERRYTGERSVDRPPRGKDDKDEYGENRRSDGNWGSRSPPYNESYSDRRSYSGRSDDKNSRYSYGERSPGYDQNDYKKSPRYFEVVDDRNRDDKSGKPTPVQRFEDRRFSEPRKPETGSPNYQKEADGSSPVVRPVRDILGDNAPQLRIGEPPKPSINAAKSIDPPKPNGTRTIEPPPGPPQPQPQPQRTSTASSIGSSDGTSEQIKAASAVSLIDFSADPEPTASAAAPQPAPAPQQQPVNAPAAQPILEQVKNAPSVSGGDWASFDAFGQQQTQHAGSNVNPLESVLAQLSFSETPSAPNPSVLPASVNPTSKENVGGQSSMMEQSHSSLFGAPLGISGNQASAGMSIQGSSVQQSSLSVPMVGLPSQLPANPQGTSGVQAAASFTDSKPVGRRELPADFFTSLYPPAAPTMPGWQRAPQFGMGYAMQYPPGMLQGMQSYPLAPFPQPTYQQAVHPQAYPQPVHPQHAYPQPMKASNPFDLGNEPSPVQAHPHLSAPLGGAAGPNSSTLLGSSSFGVAPQQPQHLYQSSAPPNHYMMQQVPNNIPEQLPNSMLPMQQGGLGSLNMGFAQEAAPRYSQPSTPPSYGSVGGNPFG